MGIVPVLQMSNGRTRSALRVLGLLVLATGVLLSFAGGASAMTDVAPTDGGGSGSNAVTTSAGSGGNVAPAAETCAELVGGGGGGGTSGGGC